MNLPVNIKVFTYNIIESRKLPEMSVVNKFASAFACFTARLLIELFLISTNSNMEGASLH
jgi:hypothetical protein